ncbi:MAG: LD-carboxypeptidase, partial [Ornithinimicrobium sp.]
MSATSSGVPDGIRPRLDVAIEVVRDRGYEVVLGECLGVRDSSTRDTSAAASERAAELTSMLTDPAIRAVVPPFGGQTAIDVLDLLDW